MGQINTIRPAVRLPENPEPCRNSCKASTTTTDQRLLQLWWKMIELYGDKWTRKNNEEPSSMWQRATAGLSDNQFEMIFTFCLDRCINGNPWPPELSDVIVMLSDKLVDSNAFGIPFDDMLRDFNKYMAKRGYYSSAEMYPFRHPVQYWIFTDLRNRVHDLRLTEPEVEKRLAKMIRQWADRVWDGRASKVWGESGKITVRLPEKSTIHELITIS